MSPVDHECEWVDGRMGYSPPTDRAGSVLMPTAPLAACLEPRCPGRAVARGYCMAHKRSEEQRGYGRAWRATRALRTGAECVACGSGRDLVLDHVVNGDPTRVQTLCRSCNTAKRNRERRHG